MKQSLEFLTEEKNGELKKIVNFIKEKYTKVNSIILFENYFNKESEFKLLIVLSKENKARNMNFRNALLGDLNANLFIKTPYKLIFHGYDYIKSMLMSKNFFFHDLINEGIMLSNPWERIYDTEEEISYELRANNAEQNYKEWVSKAEELHKQYKLSFGSGSYKIASFFLHQIAEFYLMAVSLVMTEYRPKIHGLNELFEIACNQDRKFEEVFPFHIAENKRLFHLLNDAFIKSRYDIEFVITKEELENIYKRVEILIKLSRKVCIEQIGYFKLKCASSAHLK